ncbi:NuA4 histone acetyltransferase subunit [Coemansia nantahalensis]|uniref:NuA4 histone acetyltransferase subunit n=1 Tax=Coemansia nantahalensis TaxID=2789366 RepID=A0ACC1K667_9FUNG|nr:NuA4 histone acetyltransferase subunit [Coemansia nantahalensis]
MPTYGGDEVNALVLDIGSAYTRAGFAGEDLPKAYFPSHIGYVETDVEVTETADDPSKGAGASPAASDGDVAMGDRAATRKERQYFCDTEGGAWRAGMEIGGPMEDGVVKDWDIYEKIWEYAFKTRLRVRAEEHPVIVSEAAWNTSEQRAKLVELAFEKFQCPAFFVCKTPVLAAFGTGRHTGLVVDVGGESASACAVYEGYCLTKTIRRQALGGEQLTAHILSQLRAEFNYEPTPLFDIKSKTPTDIQRLPAVARRNRAGVTDSYLSAMRHRLTLEFKESACEILERPFAKSYAESKPHKPFEFPDGFNASFSAMRYALPEALFNPKDYYSGPGAGSLVGVHELALRSVVASDIDLRPHLLNSVVLAGGSSLFPGFADRMSLALQEAIPGSRLKLYCPTSAIERKVTAWLGGSILGSLGTFHQLWISRAEYDEHGASIVDKRCL